MAKKAAKKQPKPKAPKKPSKEQREKLIAEKIDELMEARTNHALACVDWEQAHATAGAKKKNMESLQARMNQVVEDIDRIRKGNYTLPLPFGDQSKPPANGGDQAGDDHRLAVRLDTLFEGGILKSLTEAKLLTVGDLGAWTREKQVSEIPGIGPGKAEKIQDRLVQFWAENPAPATPTDPATQATAEAAPEASEATAG